MATNENESAVEAATQASLTANKDIMDPTTKISNTSNKKPSSSNNLNPSDQPHSHLNSHSDENDCEQSQSSTANSSWDNLHTNHNKKEDRRSSFRNSNKTSKPYSPRWRDQEETNILRASLSEAELKQLHLHSLHQDHSSHHADPSAASHHHNQEHNDSASQTSHTDSHHSSYELAMSDSETLPHLNFKVKHPMIHNETRFPTAMGYAASEAAKSDIATVCSGSVIEDIDRDIDMASVASGDFGMNHHERGSGGALLGSGSVASNSNAMVERFVLKKSSLGGASLGGGGTQQPHHSHHAQQHSTSQQSKHERGDSTRGVEFASHTHTYPFHQNAPSHLLGDQISRDMLAASGMNSNDDNLNDMGPPLSRTLLLAATAAASGLTDHHVGVEGNSRAGSVRSFSTGEAPSDVVAHVDTDDCGGSMSEVSQEDHKELGEARDVLVADTAGTIEPQNLGDAQNSATATTNGRVSPGGTIYKGKGVRRYQGRYMKLPLKRFHQGEFNETVVQNPLDENEDLYGDGDSDNDVPAQPPPFDDWSNSGYRSLSRSFSRSISPPPSRSRSRSESPRDNIRQRRRPSWSPHRGSERRPPIKNMERSPSRSPPPPPQDFRSNSPTKQAADHKREDEGRWRRRQSPSRNVRVREREGNDGRWRRDRWHNDKRMKSRSRSRSRSGRSPRRSPTRGRKRKGSRSRS